MVAVPVSGSLSIAAAGQLEEQAAEPFAHKPVGDTAVIVTFKIVLTIGAALLLLLARRHRLARISAWWAGVLYTVLIVL